MSNAKQAAPHKQSARDKAGPLPPKRKYAKRLQPADRRAQLLDAALRIVAEDGFTSVNIAAVAERGGVTRPVVYDSFGSRDELLEDLIERETARMAAAVERAASGDATTPDFGTATTEQLPAMVERFLTEVRSMPDTWRLVYFPIDGVPPVLRERITKARDVLRTPLAHALVRWLAEQPDADEVDPEVLTQVVYGTIQTAARLVLDDPEQFGIDRILALFDYLFVSES
ncbi:TetR/AcrR family transcriptional regulator [Nocardia sp. NBC_00565]|uniref:TetR/AcrR family transcriptional regulator n=1 Tax=Nocardia sp. NBC_00565 TaxID=2975993 RepID=UPI002E820FC6|nr:TetR/AcrR family transcriptional regulator [Nocardia sp. NBC_00565]WUC07416.1 TetR/AcrR family transcriptional regulator [Nocardia sp. NBC_00565]